MKKRVWQFHSWLGLICGLGLLVIGLSGSFLVFHEELDAWRLPALFRATPTPAGRLPFDTLWAAAQRALPTGEAIIGLRPASEPGRTDALYVTRPGEKDHRAVPIDPYTGALRGAPAGETETLTGWMTEFHYTFLAGTTGTVIAGLLAIALLLLGASGVWLYRGFWANFFTLRWGRSARIFFSDLHKMVGISSVGFYLILGFTGAWWNFQVVYGKLSTAPAAGPPTAPPLDLAGENLSIDHLVVRADKALPGFRPTFLQLPPTREGDIIFYGTVPTPNPLRGDFGSRVSFNAADGALTQVVDIRRTSGWEIIADSFALLHFGTFGGVFVKILWTLGGLTPGILAVSGFLLWRARLPSPGRRAPGTIVRGAPAPASRSLDPLPIPATRWP